jgi:hypothetical protein
MATVVKFEKAPCQSALEVAQGLVARIEAGDVRACAVIAVLPDGSIGTSYAFGDDSRPYASLIGACQVLSSGYWRRTDDEEEGEIGSGVDRASYRLHT